MHEATPKLAAPRWAKAALFLLTFGAGACSAVLDFTECRSDEDCAIYFVDNRPMYCNQTEFRCKVKNPGCEGRADCANHSENSICGLSNECFELEVGDGAPCDEPVYPSGDGEVVYIGSIIHSGADYANGVEDAIALAIQDFNESASISDRKVAWIRCDSGGSLSQAEAAASYLAGKEVDGDIVGVGVAGIIGPIEDSAFKRVAGVSVAGGVNAFTISPGAVGPVGGDNFGVVWRGSAGAERRAAAIKARAQGLGVNKALVLYGNESQGDYAESVFGAFDGNIAPAQENLLYNSQLSAADIVSLLPKQDLPDLYLMIGGDEIADILVEFVTQQAPIPQRIMVTERGANAVLKAVTMLGSSAQDLIDSLEIVAPNIPSNPVASSDFRTRLTSEFPGSTAGDFVELAYDSTLMTLLAASSRSSTSGPNVAAGLQQLVDVNGIEVAIGTSPGVQEAAQRLAGAAINLTGVSSNLSLNFATRDTCHDFVAYKVSAVVNPTLSTISTMPVSCPDGFVGTWSE